MEKGQDLISRRAAIEAVRKISENPFLKPDDTDRIWKSDAIEALRDLPTVQSERKDGEWIEEGFYADGHSEHAYRCSECGEHYIGFCGEFNFCPNCGVDLRGGLR